MGEIVVTGSFIRSQGFRPSSPVDVLKPLDIQSHPAQNLSTTLGNLPYVIAPVGGGGPGGGPGNGTVGQLNLRNLGPAATLVLVDSQRVAPFAETDSYADVNAIIPQIMIRNLEILKDGASALYGSDAVAGVINILPRTNFSGLELSAEGNWKTTGGEGNRRFGSIMGNDVGDKAHFVLAFQYDDQDLVPYSDVPALRGAVNNFGSVPGFFASPGQPGIYSVPKRDANGNLTGSSTTNVDPLCGTVPLSAVTGSGAARTCSYYFPADQSLQARDRRLQAFFHGKYEFSKDTLLTVQGSYSNDYAQAPLTVSGPINSTLTVPYTNPGVTGALLVPATNSLGQRLYALPDPRNPALPLRNSSNQVVLSSTPTVASSGVPFFEDLGWQGRFLGSQGGLPTGGAVPAGQVAYSKLAPAQRDFFRGSAKLEGRLTEAWHWSASANYSENRETTTNTASVAILELQNALLGFGGANCNRATGVAGQGQCFYFNPFGNSVYAAPGSPQANNPAVLSYINPPITDRYVASVATGDFLVTGDLIQLPAGPLSVAAGLQWRRDAWRVDYDSHKLTADIDTGIQSVNVNASRNTLAEFAEFSIPVFNVETLGRLNLSAALRHEDSGASLVTTTPKVGGIFTTTDGKFSLRGDWGRSFLAPSLLNMNATTIGTLNVTDPLFPAGLPRVTTITKGNPNLQPQTSEVFSGGVVLRPVSRLKIDVGYFHYKFDKLLSSQSGQVVINADPNGPAIVRDPNTGQIQSVTLTNFNAAGLTTSGVDLEVDYAIPMGRFGDITLSGLATYVPQYDFQATSTSAVQHLAGNYNNTQPANVFPAFRWRATGGVHWILGPHNLTVNVNYLDSLRNDRAASTAPDAIIPSYATVDMSYVYSFNVGRMGVKGATLGAGVQNLFDKTPPTISFFNTLVSGPYNYFGREAFVRATASF